MQCIYTYETAFEAGDSAYSGFVDREGLYRIFGSLVRGCANWRGLIHRLIVRYYPNSLFVKQIKELLVLRQRRVLASTALEMGVFGFLHRDRDGLP
jgi:hypothetical protein